MKIYLDGTEKLPQNFTFTISGNSVTLIYIYQTTRPVGTIINSAYCYGPVYEILKNGKKRKYIDYKTKFNLEDCISFKKCLGQVILQNYFELKKIAMTHSRIFKLQEFEKVYDMYKNDCKKQNKLKKVKLKMSKLNEELEYLKKLEFGQSFSGYVFTDKYKFESENLPF